jgi:alkaline phosphatase D
MSKSYRSRWITRRSFLHGVAAAGGSLVAAPLLSRPVLADTAKPSITHGVQSGDILTDRAIIWARADRPSQMLVDWCWTRASPARPALPGPMPWWMEISLRAWT